MIAFPNPRSPSTTVDIKLVNDVGTGTRASRLNNLQIVALGVTCFMHDHGSTFTTAGEREAMLSEATFCFFGDPVELTTDHVLIHTDTVTEVTNVWEVRSMTGRRFPNFPDKVQCFRYGSSVSS